MEIKTITTEVDIMICKDIILAFRNNLKEENLVEEVLYLIKNESFKIKYLYDDKNHKAAAFIGYRNMRMLRTGPTIYIDDLYTDPDYRSQGCGATLLGEVKQEAIETGMKSVHLDSGFALHPAHRLYLNSGYVLACHHFAQLIS